MKSTKFHCLALMTKQWIGWISSWLPELIRKNSYLNNYLKKLFCQAYCFNFFSSQNSFLVKHIVLIFSLARTDFLSIYKNIVRCLACHSKFEKRKALKKELNEELILTTRYPRRWWNFACQKIKIKKKNHVMQRNGQCF